MYVFYSIMFKYIYYLIIKLERRLVLLYVLRKNRFIYKVNFFVISFVFWMSRKYLDVYLKNFFLIFNIFVIFCIEFFSDYLY